jgi:DNA-binding GntR family transcriptional regulator
MPGSQQAGQERVLMPTNDIAANPAVDRLERSTLGRQIAEAIRDDIVYGRLKPGAKLAQQQVCDRFGTSRMPVRDALRQLVYEGFLIAAGSGRCVVAPLNAQDMEDTFMLQGVLHGIAARRVAEAAPQETIDRLVRAHEEMATHVHAPLEFNPRNNAFHRDINRAADSPKIIAMLRAIAMSVPRDFEIEFPQWVTRANTEHGEIVAAFAARKGARAEKLTRDHVVWAGKYIVQFLETKGVELTHRQRRD